ncbi:MAG: hypothetical protein JXR96_21325 [Deltaproteobacteria bacterium]|nr:hypothetical protein [Deltaproteobacteria bacterium]
MSDGKKVWFHRLSSRLWLPISWEGWAVLAGLVVGLLAIVKIHAPSAREPIVLSRDWPALLELAVLVAAFYWICRGRVRR